MKDRPETLPQEAAGRGFVAFCGVRRIASGGLARVAPVVRRALLRDPAVSVVFDGETGKVADLDLRGTEQEVRARYSLPPAPPRGRPKLGVVAREVTLLPRHWDWLSRQPGGASITLRKLVEAARKADGGATESRERSESAYRFMSAMAGDRPGFEEAARALFAGDRQGIAAAISQWPPDIGDEVLRYFEGTSRQGVSSCP
jgi:hypothetical protein